MMHGKRSSRSNQPLSWEIIMQAMRSKTAHCVYVLLVCTVVLCALFLLAITPQRYDLKVGDISPTTITASKDVVDEISTTRQRDLAAQKVEPTYIFKENVAGEVKQNLTSILQQLSTVQQYGMKVLEQQYPENPDAQKGYKFTEEELKYARTLLTQLNLNQP